VRVKERRKFLVFVLSNAGGMCLGWFLVGLILMPSLAELYGFLFGLFLIILAIHLASRPNRPSRAWDRLKTKWRGYAELIRKGQPVPVVHHIPHEVVI
jgi:uncharacterized membrane protein YfcA